jgi:hypothetical protein
MKFALRHAPLGDRDQIHAPRKRSRLILFSGAIAWLLFVVLGLWLLMGYENTPGVAAAPPVQWPVDSQIQRTPNRATLIILAHPHCPCTRATVGELAAIMAHSQGRLTAYVLFIKPEGVRDDWDMTDLWQSASRIPGVQVIQDVDGGEAHRFHTSTSGQAILYDSQGRLLFTGGITASRGHSGDNAGRSAIVSLVNGESSEQLSTTVFGCPLFDSKSECRVPNDQRTKH